MALSFGRLKIGSKFYDYSDVSRTGRDVTFTMTSTMPYFPSETDVFSVAASINESQTINTANDDLLLQSGTADPFPLLNGIIEIDEHFYSYKKRDNNALTGIKDPLNPDELSFAVKPNTDIILRKFVKLHSTGIFGEGDLEAKRKIIYHVSLPVEQGETVVFHDAFEDKSHWEDSTLGSHEIQTIDDDKALKVSGTDSIGAGDVGSLIALDSSTTEVDLVSAHEFADHHLSYDAQVKIGFDPWPPISDYYMAGITFRLDSLAADANSYGVSFLRADNNFPLSDKIPDEIVPLNDTDMIVLWQQTNSGQDKTWLAYKNVKERVFFSDDMEGDTNGWTATGLWHKTGHRYQSESPDHSWYYGQENLWDYDIGTNRGSLTSQAINLCSAAGAVLYFWSWYETEANEPYVNSYDLKYVEIHDGTGWQKIYQLKYPGHPMGIWGGDFNRSFFLYRENY